MKEKTAITFKEIFGSDPLLVQSPGRINLIGEHTDYNGGFVMPAAINKAMTVAIAKNNLNRARIYALDLEEEFAFALDSFGPKKGHWATYIMGVTAQLQQAGYPVQGFDMVFGGNIPIGAGLSSSAALECAVAFAISSLFGFDIPKRSLIHYAQKAEHLFASVQCGIMDQFASVMGKAGHAILLDCKDLEYSYFPLDLKDHCLLLVDTQVKHSLAESAYNQRRQECQQGLEAAKKIKPEATSLRELTLDILEEIKPDIPEIVFQRCSYVLKENSRVLQAAEALNHNNLSLFGQLMYASHEGLSKSYEVSCEELDFLVEATKNLPYVLGSRMMGGGFGGCTLNLVEKNKVDEIKQRLEEAYLHRFRQKPLFYEVSLRDGTGSL